jgi:hypothetical protein
MESQQVFDNKNKKIVTDHLFNNINMHLQQLQNYNPDCLGQTRWKAK